MTKIQNLFLIIIYLSFCLLIYLLLKRDDFSREYSLNNHSTDEILEIKPIRNTNIRILNETKVFCMIKSYLKNYRINKTQTIYNVWGRKCDEYRFIMIIPEDLRPENWQLGKEMEIEHPFRVLQPVAVVSETHENITMKIYNAFISIYKRFPNYPWYFLVDDDSYVNVDNLRMFLATKDPYEMITYGYDFTIKVNIIIKICDFVLRKVQNLDKILFLNFFFIIVFSMFENVGN